MSAAICQTPDAAAARLERALAPGSRPRCAGLPPGQEARLVAALARRRPGGVIHVGLDATHMAAMAEQIAFFAPDMETVQIPGWDCLPYDRVSPKPDITAQRVEALSRLAAGDAGPGPLVLTTVGAVLQSVPPPEAFAGARLAVAAGGQLDPEAFRAFAECQGYTRTDTVREPGEYAIRGGILDLFPPGFAEPLRLDLFGDEVERIRSFDPLSQRSTGERARLDLAPMAEFSLDADSIARFRSRYRELFGAVRDSDPLYAAISEGRRHPGMEHWLPLFHARMVRLPDYLPEAALCLPEAAEAAVQARLDQIRDFYRSRLEMQAAERKAEMAVYKPLPPEYLYLDPEAWSALAGERPVAELSPFAPAETTAGAEGPPAGAALDAAGRKGLDFAPVRANPQANVHDALADHLSTLAQGEVPPRVLICAYSEGARERLMGVFREHGLTRIAALDSLAAAGELAPGVAGVVVLGLERGFAAPDLVCITEQDILGDRIARRTGKRRRSEALLQEVSALSEGDLVVHAEHGIGRYDGLVTLEMPASAGGAPHDFLKLVYEGEDRLFVPVENIEVLSRFGAGDAPAALDRLGGTSWQARKARVKKRLKDMAGELMQVAARRALDRAPALEAPAGSYEEFCARFPYPETEDQDAAIADVLGDLARGQAMDRLVCGDVGFGKTEIALRAAFAAAMNGVQVAVVVPTTLLARQHYQTFCERFRGFPLKIGHLSRLTGQTAARKTREALAAGDLDIVIGTHALLSKSVRFAHLGLMIVDEEQRFGVRQKERLKKIRENVHVLAMSATPIPRTLQLALSGVRELSLIATPPVDRLAVRSFVLPEDPVVLREAILREHWRGGQVFYVAPRIKYLDTLRARLAEMVPEVKLVTATGQMAASELEEVMTAFDARHYDVLLATNIIESGLDIPNANTLIVHRADMFSLAQLYQLRGRVGRGKQRGYAYLTWEPRKPLTAVAQQRLHILETLDTLGAGFNLASHDLDMRGAGNLLGEEQSGHVKEVGIELYQQMLEEAVVESRAESEPGVGPGAGAAPPDRSWTPQINLGTPVLIPDRYVPDLNVRLSLYRRVAELEDRAEIDAFAAELIDRFGPLPGEVQNLLDVITVKQLCRQAHVERVEAGPKGAVVRFRDDTPPDVAAVMGYVADQAGTVKIRPDQKLACIRHWPSTAARVEGVTRLMQDLAGLAQKQAA